MFDHFDGFNAIFNNDLVRLRQGRFLYFLASAMGKWEGRSVEEGASDMRRKEQGRRKERGESTGAERERERERETFKAR